MAKLKVHRKPVKRATAFATDSVDARIRALFRKRPTAADWGPNQIADAISANVSTVKVSPAYREQVAERLGSAITKGERAVLGCLTSGPMDSVQVSREADLNRRYAMRLLGQLAKRGLCESRNAAGGGYRLTPQGKAALRVHRKPR